MEDELKCINLEITDQQEEVDKIQSDIYKVMDAASIDTASNSKCLNKLQTEKRRLKMELIKSAAIEEELRAKMATLKENFEAQKEILWQMMYYQDSVQSDDGAMLLHGRGHNDDDDSDRLRYSWTSDDQSLNLSVISSSSLRISKSNISSISSIDDVFDLSL